MKCESMVCEFCGSSIQEKTIYFLCQNIRYITDKTKYGFKSIYTCIVKKNIQDVDLRYKNFKSCFWQSTLTQTYILCFIASVSRLIFQFPMYIKKNLLFCHRTQAIVLHHMFFNNYLEFSIACGNIFIPSILL